MNQDYVGQSKGRCSTAGFDKNELKFSAYVKQPNPFQPKEEQDPEVHLA